MLEEEVPKKQEARRKRCRTWRKPLDSSAMFPTAVAAAAKIVNVVGICSARCLHMPTVAGLNPISSLCLLCLSFEICGRIPKPVYKAWGSKEGGSLCSVCGVLCFEVCGSEYDAQIWGILK